MPWRASRSMKAITARPASTVSRIAAIFKWPGPIHEGNGEVIAFVDEKATDRQREALLRIMSGQDTDPFATMFAVFASTVTKMNEPVFTKIDLELDIDGRRGRIFVKDYIDTVGRADPQQGDGRRIARPDRVAQRLRIRSRRDRQRFEQDRRAGSGRDKGHLRPVRAAASQQSRGRASLTRRMNGASPLERLLGRDRLVTVAGLAVLCVLAWLYIVTGAGLGMNAWEMTKARAVPPPASSRNGSRYAWDGHVDGHGRARHGHERDGGRNRRIWGPAIWTLMIAMWWIMMIAMMSPSAAPTVLLYARVHRHALAERQSQEDLAPTGVFVAGYLLVWLGFSVAAAALYWLLERTAKSSPRRRWPRRAAGFRPWSLSPRASISSRRSRTPACRIAGRRRRSCPATGVPTRSARCAWAPCTGLFASDAAGC